MMYEFGNDRLGDEGVVRHGMMMLLREIALAVRGDVCEFSVVPICRMMKSRNSTNSSLDTWLKIFAH